MDEQRTLSCLLEAASRDVRLRLCVYQTACGLRYGTEVSAFDARAGRWAAGEFCGGMTFPRAMAIFDGMVRLL